MRDRTETSQGRNRRLALSALTWMALSQVLFPSFWQNFNSLYTSGIPFETQLPSPKEARRSDEQLGVDGLYDDNTQVYLVKFDEE